MAGKSYKFVSCQGSVSGAIEDAVSALTELGEECTGAADNFPNSDHPKAEAFREAGSTLEGISVEVGDLPDDLAEQTVQYQEAVPRAKRRSPSRSVRCSNACAMLQASADRLQEWLDDDANKDHDDRGDVETLISECESAISEAEGVEFPGMFG